MNSTEAEIISLDAGLCMEGTPTLNLWDTIIDTLRPQAGGDFKRVHQTQILEHHEPFEDMDCVPPNVRLFSMRISLYIFENNEAEIKHRKTAVVLQCVMCHTHIVSIWIGLMTASI